MSKYTLAIVGAKFRPPAAGLLSVLPTGCALIVRREPSNAYDENAMMVLVKTIDFYTAEFAQKLTEACAGYGFSAEDIRDARPPEWHLGYIPRQDALILAPRMDKSGVRETNGALTFSAEGHPRVQFSLDEE